MHDSLKHVLATDEMIIQCLHHKTGAQGIA